jgi:hypothetical protein
MTSATAFSRFPPRLQTAIVSRLGWASLRPVQELASHAILDGKNVAHQGIICFCNFSYILSYANF